MKSDSTNEAVKITILDIRIAVSAVICYLSAVLLKEAGIIFTNGEMHLEILQTMTSVIACLLCCQDDTGKSELAGKNRLIITAIGGIVGMAVACIDNVVGSLPVMTLMIGTGLLLTLLLCKEARVPYINARIGGITFILVACTMSGNARMWYALFRFISTLYGVIVVLIVTYVFQQIKLNKGGSHGQTE